MTSENDLSTREIQLHIPEGGIAALSNDLLSSFENSTKELEERISEGADATTENETELGKGLSNVVAQHYNQLEEKGLAERKESRIFHMRNLNNWIKSRMIGNILDEIRNEKGRPYSITVLDLGCGKGGDLRKWERGNIHHIVCADIAETSIEQCKERYNTLTRQKRRVFTAEFIAADCTKVKICNLMERKDLKIDLVSCQFAFHYSFESLPQAEQMLANVSSNLQVGGYFIGTTTDANDIIRRLNRDHNPGNRGFGNSIFSVEFPAETPLDPPPLFGAKYNFHLEGVVDCPEFLVHFPTFVKLADRYGLELVKRTRFEDYVDLEMEEGRDLLWRMKALETYNPTFTRLASDDTSDYAHAEHNFTSSNDRRGRVGTLSKSEWEAVSLYLMYVFRKTKDIHIN